MPPQSLSRALYSSSRASSRNLRPKYSPLTSIRHKSGPYGYTQAKALVYSKYGEPDEVLTLHNHSISPSLPSDNVLLRTLAAPINPADYNQIQGVYPIKPPMTSLLGTPQPSAVAGNEACFEVQSVGSGVTSLQKGDWVVALNPGFGTWRTHALASPSQLIKIDKSGLTPIQAATVAVNPCTAFRMLRDYKHLNEGEWFVQNAANSGVGRAAIQIGRIWGLKSINVIREREKKEDTEALRKEMYDLGATQVVTEAELMAPGFRDQVKEWTNGGREQIRLGLNGVGGKPTGALIKCLSNSAELVTYGGMAKAPIQVGAGMLIFKDLKFSGFFMSRFGEAHPDEKRKTVNEILGWIREKKFHDAPVKVTDWAWETNLETLKEAVDGTLGGFRSGKRVFLFPSVEE